MGPAPIFMLSAPATYRAFCSPSLVAATQGKHMLAFWLVSVDGADRGLAAQPGDLRGRWCSTTIRVWCSASPNASWMAGIEEGGWPAQFDCNTGVRGRPSHSYQGGVGYIEYCSRGTAVRANTVSGYLPPNSSRASSAKSSTDPVSPVWTTSASLSTSWPRMPLSLSEIELPRRLSARCKGRRDNVPPGRVKR